ncbi:MAG: T9SS type A sorting domain-containing protein [Bacteroidetes bacterium]|nr:T9SS type A sorting domain-containing protein [Bacteroidota bacterium]
MKKTTILLTPILLVTLLLFSFNADHRDDTYLVIGWNDLGMHCSNKDFSKIAILPPYNNLNAVVIKKGTATTLPEIITSNVTVNYSIPGNTYSVGKTNFWDYVLPLFGVSLPDNIRLTGAGLTGVMDIGDNAFAKEGIPLTPYTDANLVQEDPYQLALFEVYDANSIIIATTQNVIPVSNEINCVSSGCHSSENVILNEHELEGGFDPNNIPILCAECHSSNALGTPGHPGVPSLSLAIHDQHKDETNDCYKCHPGPNTQCFRGVMHDGGMVCQDCHGSVANVASTIENGREPWLEEPSCGATDCHGPDYAEEPGKLFRQSKGHADLYCSTCHGEPHALTPSTLPNDNLQNIALQGFAGVLKKCIVCHGVDPVSPGPHNLLPTSISEISGDYQKGVQLDQNYPNPFTSITHIPFSINEPARVHLGVYSIDGKNIVNIINTKMIPGKYVADLNNDLLTPGTYIVILEVSGIKKSINIVAL